MSTPFFSIVSVCYGDAWALSKTARSVFRQSEEDFEYVVVDGGSTDGTPSLIEFWQAAGLIDVGISEPDGGVYEAMNKGVGLSRGHYVCMMNAGDVFAHDDVLAEARAILERGGADGVLGWGELNGRVWASWHEGAAFKLSSLGFCHQALFARRELLAECPFDDRRHKTDSDTLQLGRLYDAGAKVEVVPEVWALRGGDPGISADLDRTARSITDTISAEYGLSEEAAGALLAFRRRAEEESVVLDMLAAAESPLREHLALMILDTLFQPQARELPEDRVAALRAAALEALGEDAAAEERRLLTAQSRRAQIARSRSAASKTLAEETRVFAQQEDARFAKMTNAPGPSAPITVALTSFPARLQSLAFVIRSLTEQTRPPERIVLTLGRDEVPSRKWLPGALLAFEERGLEVAFVDRTCHQYDKYLHHAGENAERPFVIVDDDVIYPPYALEQLLAGHEAYPDAVVGNRCHRIGVDEDGALGPYASWTREQRTPAPSHALMPTGAGGVLYPPGFLTEAPVTDRELILGHAPYADDLWLKFNAMAQGRRVFATALSQGSDWYHRYTPTMQAGTLMATNVQRGLNDLQVRRCAAWLDGVEPGWRASLVADHRDADDAAGHDLKDSVRAGAAR